MQQKPLLSVLSKKDIIRENNMTNNISTIETGITTEWCTEEFIYTSVKKFLKESGYKVQKEALVKEGEIVERKIVATKFFKKETIEVKGYPNYLHSPNILTNVTSSSAKNWFTEALFNSFVNFSIAENTEVAIALPNVARYQAIIEKLNNYFTVNDLYFKIYLVNKDGTIEVANLNEKYSSPKY